MRLPADIFDKRQEGACALVPHPNLLPCFALSGTYPGRWGAAISLFSLLPLERPSLLSAGKWADPPAGHGLPSTSLRISLASVPLPAVDDGLAEAVMGPAWWSRSCTEKTQLQVCSQLARGPKEPWCIISVLLSCIVCWRALWLLLSHRFVFSSGHLS